MEADLQNTPLYLLSYLVIELFGDSDTRLIISAPSNLFIPGYLVIGLFGDADKHPPSLCALSFHQVIWLLGYFDYVPKLHAHQTAM